MTQVTISGQPDLHVFGLWEKNSTQALRKFQVELRSYAAALERCVGAEAVTWLPGFSVPVSQCDSGCRRVQAFPPYSSVTGLTDISEDGVFGDGGHGVGVGLVRGAGCDAKEAILWVDGSQFTCREDGIMPQTLRMDHSQLQTLLLETQT